MNICTICCRFPGGEGKLDRDDRAVMYIFIDRTYFSILSEKTRKAVSSHKERGE